MVRIRFCEDDSPQLNKERKEGAQEFWLSRGWAALLFVRVHVGHEGDQHFVLLLSSRFHKNLLSKVMICRIDFKK